MQENHNDKELETGLNEDNIVAEEKGLTEEEELLLVEEEVAIEKEYIRDEEIKKDGKMFHYAKVLLGGIIDQIIAVAMAILLFAATGFVLKLFGYQIAMKDEMFLIIYIISNVLYYPLIAEFMHGKTLGKKIMFR